MRDFLLISVCVVVTLFGGCVMDNKESKVKTQFGSKDWVEGRAYHSRGKDTTIYSEPYYSIEFNKDSKNYDTTWYQKKAYRYWEHEYTAGGMRKNIWYWDEDSRTWYSFARSGGYYIFEWRYKTFRIEKPK